jgi:hypothetical protein
LIASVIFVDANFCTVIGGFCTVIEEFGSPAVGGKMSNGNNTTEFWRMIS